MVDEVEHAVVCPVQILEHEDERPLFRHRLEQATPRPEGLGAVVAREVHVGAETDERA